MKKTFTQQLLRKTPFPASSAFRSAHLLSMAVKKYGRMAGLLCIALHGAQQSKADFTVAAGSTVRADTINRYDGVLTINGTLAVSRNTVLAGFTKVVINAPSGQIYWTNNSDISFAAGTSISIKPAAPGLRPVGGNSSQRLWVGTTLVAVANDNSGAAALTFNDMNEAGGLPEFTLSLSATTACYGTALTASLVPLTTSMNYDCSWSIDNGASLSPASAANFSTPRLVTITAANTTVSKLYTISCRLFKSGDGNPIVTKTISVTVNPIPAVPSAAAVYPAAVCLGASASLTATSPGNTIEWFTNSTGGNAVHSSSSGTAHLFTPSAGNSYYAGVLNASTGCRSSSRLLAGAVAVSQPSAGGISSGSAHVCKGMNSNRIIANGYTGSVIKWQSSQDNFATATDIMISNDTLLTSNISNTTSYRAMVANGVCPLEASTPTTISVLSTIKWQGINTDWNDGANWCNGQAPSADANISIDSGLLFYPEITGRVAVNDLYIAAGALVKIANTGSLIIAGAIHSKQGIDATAGTIEMAGTGPQTIRAADFVNNRIEVLTVSNTWNNASAANPSVSIVPGAGMLNISNKVSFGNTNHAILQTNDLLTLLSNAAHTAGIADLTNNNNNSNNSIAGKVVIERYIPARRAWRFLTAPVTPESNVTIAESWQEGATVTDPAASTASTNPAPGYGTHVSFGFPVANPGYDLNINGNTSIKYFTATGSNGVPFATNTGLITDEPGYLVFVRGDRSTQLSWGTAAPATATVLRVKGFIYHGLTNVMLPVAYKSGNSNFRVFRNPYPAAISFNKIVQNPVNQAAGFSNSFYVWDANLGGKTGSGGWVALSYNASTGQYDKSVASTIDASGYIQSGSAVLIDYNGPAHNVAVRETDKVEGSNNSMYRNGGTPKNIRTSLSGKNINGSTYLIDAAMVVLDEVNSDEIDSKDMGKMENFEESFSLIKNDHPLAIERRKPIVQADTIFYRITNMKQQQYQLQVELESVNLPQGSTVYLEDLYLQSKTLVSTHTSTVYDFSIDNNILSAAPGRFRLVFTTTPDLEKEKRKDPDNSNPGIDKQHFSIAPNPVATNAIYLQISDAPAGNYQVRLMNTAGVTVAEKIIQHAGGKAMYSIEPSRSLINGNYHLQIVAPGKKISILQVLVQKK
jgi:hypothetical protein